MRQRVFVATEASVVAYSWAWSLAIAGAQRTGSVLLSQVLTEAGVTPAVDIRGPAPLATPSSHAESARHTRNGVHSATEVAARAVLVHWRPPCREDPVSTSEGGSGALVHGRAEP